ncbi:FAD-binding type 2 [Penicillium cf. griseofulvum]|uniref:FAD-binding type 2 n=1 Tax=Penicillium cf. griseofulvum TaxID=2972120 RepID=A0A9W9J631_9EURO|nr:FAD-binding type 2 [Penicillium cf. griseofulvum]KAJ5434041.1 FAD-binding type 2 [Penicillium cf. griseofulvum]
MAIRFWPFLISVIAAAARSPNGDTDPLCRNIPGDKGWPNQGAWHRLNNTVGGRLIETVPLAHICHDTGIYPAFNEPACEDLQEAFNEAGAHTLYGIPYFDPYHVSQPQPGEFMNAYFLNTSCSPFTPKSVPCELGNRAVYSINVTGPTDVQAGMKFASENNIRLVVKSTGIDYMGKSTGYGALSLWMYNLKTIDVIPDYVSPQYSGAAVKLGPGVITGEAYQAMNATGYRIVAPECGLSGIAGGYLQGVGHSQLVTKYGAPADQVLEWELVTPAGKYLTATPKKNKDLYWALAGGGGGTYGVVLSVTIKAYPDGPVAGGTLVVNNTNDAAFWEAIGSWFHRGPSFVENSPNNVQFLVRNATLQVFSLVLPDQESSAVDALVSPFIDDLKRLNLPYELKTGQAPTYADSLVSSYGPLPYGNLCPSFPVISSRLIPRATVLNTTSNAELMDAYRSITADGKWFIGCSFINVEENSPIRGPHPPNSVHPAWRKAIAYCNPNNPWDWEDPAKSLALKKQLVDEFFPAIEAATPGSGVNLNEMDPWYKGDWKQTMYGDNYQRLLKIKHDHDPHRLMYGHFAVGADEFTLDKDNRLCRVR